MNIGKKLKEKRLEANYTQKDLAEILHVSRQTISSWEVGRTYPDLDVLIAISELYETPLDDLLKGDSDMVQDITNKVKQSERRNLLTIALGAVLTAILVIVLFSLWEGYQKNQENEYGLKQTDLTDSSWEMFYSPDSQLVSSLLSFDSDSVMIRNQYEMVQDPFIHSSDLDSSEDGFFGYRTEEYENLSIELVDDKYLVTGQGYQETFEKMTDNAIRDSEGTEYYFLNDSSLHEAIKHFENLDELENLQNFN